MKTVIIFIENINIKICTYLPTIRYAIFKFIKKICCSLLNPKTFYEHIEIVKPHIISK